MKHLPFSHVRAGGRAAGARLLVSALLLATAGSTAAQVVGSLPQRPQDPYSLSQLEPVMDALTFRLSFDSETILPDMAAGKTYQPQVVGSYDGTHKAPAFAPGMVGKALVLGTGCGVYPRAGNLLLDQRGAVALWVKPLEWTRPNGSNVVFVMTSDAAFYLQRQGPMRGEDGKIKRHEHVQFLAKASKQQRQYTGLMGGRWENGSWYFLVANWAWPSMELSINGQPFSTKALSAKPDGSVFGNIVVGARGGDAGLLDEVLFFRRPLALDEVKLLYRTFAAANGGAATGRTTPD